VLSWVHVLEWRAAVTPDAVALSDDRGAALTYAALAAAVERSAAEYAAAGIRPGDVTAIIARNQVGWVTALFGLVRAGALPAAVNWRLAVPEVTALLQLMRPAAIVSDADCAALAKQAAAGLDGPEPVLLGLGEPPAADPPGPQAERPAVRPVDRPVDRLRGPEPLVLLHTSGTTGRPKLGAWARGRLAGFKCPTGVTVVSQLPRNATGKVLRSALREQLRADRDRRVS
jgi:acyl-CoA synthetase (AMP-forming)/AMP-acid ligase II